jgi:hypothetical protein
LFAVDVPPGQLERALRHDAVASPAPVGQSDYSGWRCHALAFGRMTRCAFRIAARSHAVRTPKRRTPPKGRTPALSPSTEPGHDSSERVRDQAVVAALHRPQCRITSLLVDEAKRLIAFRCERSAAEQLAAIARHGDRSLSAEIRRRPLICRSSVAEIDKQLWAHALAVVSVSVVDLRVLSALMGRAGLEPATD